MEDDTVKIRGAYMERIVLFDGVCNVCDRSVQFIIAHDPAHKFQFASLQSEVGETFIENYQLPKGLDSMVFIEGEDVYFKSTAALKIAKQLSGFYSVLAIFLVIPTPIRDFLYDVIAKNRYKWFGKKDHCMIPDPEDRQRFLD